MPPVFNFVTVRNPRRPRKREIDVGFVRYDEDLQASLADDLAAGREPDEEEARRYASVTTEMLEERMPAVVAWGEWLAEKGPQATWLDVSEHLGEEPVPEKQAGMAAILWNVLAASVLVGGRPEVRETAIWGLRALNVVGRGKRHATGEEPLGRLARATVLLPTPRGDEEILQREVDEARMAGEATEAAEDAGPGGGEAGEAGERLAALEHAHEALTALMAEEREWRALDDPPPPVVPEVGGDGVLHAPEPAEADEPPRKRRAILDADAMEKLDERAVAALDELGVPRGVRVAYAVDRVERAARATGAEAARDVAATRSVVQIGGALWMKHASPSHTHEPDPGEREDVEYEHFHSSTKKGRTRCRIKPLGIADFRRVEQELDCYEAGEVAHVENVMLGETKERTTRRLRRSEVTFTQASEEERTEERDTQTTDRFELEREASKVVESDLEASIGVDVAAQYGPVRIGADARFATSTSTQESDRQASTYAKEVTDRAASRVVERVREERVNKTIDEFEETNLHRLDNADGEGHVVGLYRWVDKRYEARVVNYGKRLMFELLVPEPAAFHLHAMANEPVEGTLRIEKPVDPRSDEAQTVFGRPPLRAHTDVTTTNYALWAAAYDASVEPPPAATVTMAKTYHREAMDHTTQFADSKNDLKIPAGYEGSSFSASFGMHREHHSGGWNWITVIVGRHSAFREGGGSFSGGLNSEDDIVPVTVMGRTRFYAMTVEVDCARTPAALEAWRVKTFEAIVQGYNDRVGAYETALAEARAKAAGTIQGTNPAMNREIEQTELKRGAIRLLTCCQPLPSEAMQDNGDCGYPEFACAEAERDGAFIQFFEQAFEWALLTYTFYPYFWGRRCHWQEIYRLEDTDPLFLRFLRAGFARVVVPVRPGYEEAALRYLADGEIWGGGDAPGVDSPMYVAIANELKEPVGEVDPDIAPWPVTIPTSLTVLQCESGCVPGAGLPCPGGAP